MLFTKLLRSLSISFLAAETRKKNNTRNISIPPPLITLNVSTLSLPFQRHAYIQSLQMSFFLLVISQLARNFYYKKGCELFSFFVSSTQFNERAGREIERERRVLQLEVTVFHYYRSYFLSVLHMIPFKIELSSIMIINFKLGSTGMNLNPKGTSDMYKYKSC